MNIWHSKRLKGEEGILAHGESRKKKVNSQEKSLGRVDKLQVRGVCSAWRRVAGTSSIAGATKSLEYYG